MRNRPLHVWNCAAAVGLVLLFLGAVTASAHRTIAADPRADDHALQAAQAGLEYARTALAWDPAWQGGPASSGLLQLLTDGPYRIAFVAEATPLGPAEPTSPAPNRTLRGSSPFLTARAAAPAQTSAARYRVQATGLVANFLLSNGVFDNVRGAGGDGIRFFPFQVLQAVARGQGEAEIDVDPRTGFPLAHWIAPPQLGMEPAAAGLPQAPP